MKYVCRCRMCGAEFDVETQAENKEAALEELSKRPAFFLHDHRRSEVWGLGEIIGIRDRVRPPQFASGPAQDG